jgi:hypothetical protein
MTVIGVRRSAAAAPPAGIDRIVTIDRIDEALGVADHVAIALPLTAETRGLFSAALIAKMKPGAYLYNVGRGAIVDPAALLDALRSGHLAAPVSTSPSPSRCRPIRRSGASPASSSPRTRRATRRAPTNATNACCSTTSAAGCAAKRCSTWSTSGSARLLTLGIAPGILGSAAGRCVTRAA